MDDFVSAEFQQKQHLQNQLSMYDANGKDPQNDRIHGNTMHVPPQMYGGDDMWQMNQQLPQSYWPGQMQQVYQGNQRRMDSNPYLNFQQFQNMNSTDHQVMDAMRNNYPPYLHIPNQDPEVAQAMLNLGNNRDGNHPMGGIHPHMNDPAAHFYPPLPPHYYQPMDMQHHIMPGHDPGSYYSNVQPRDHPIYHVRDPRDHAIPISIPPQQHPIAMDRKRKRPIDMPRRPLSAYNFYFSEERERILASLSENEGEDVTDLGQKDDGDQKAKEHTDITSDPVPTKSESKSDRGDGDDDSEPAPSTSEAKADKVDDNDPDTCGERLLTQRWEDSKKRRPHRKSHGKIAFNELAKLIGNRWRKISPEKKEKYNLLAERDLDRYNQQMKDYSATRVNKTNNLASNFGPNSDPVAQNMPQHVMVPPQHMQFHQHQMAPQQVYQLNGAVASYPNVPSDDRGQNVNVPSSESLKPKIDE